MAHVITLPCIGTKDASCVSVCPVGCIHPADETEGIAAAEMLYIDPAGCIDCGACIHVCPVNAIFLDSDVPAEWHEYIEKNAAYFRK